MSQSSTKSVFKKYLTWDNIIFIIILASILIYLFFQVVILKTASPQVAVTTTSMVPTYEGFDLTQNYNLNPRQYYDILRGDLLIVQNIEPHVGDVAVFKAPGEATPIVHRLVAERIVNGIKEFATKGDHNPTTDASSLGNNFGWIPRSSILGVVVFSIHYLGWFSLQLQDPLIRAFLIIATVGIIALAIFDSTRPKSETENEEHKEQIEDSESINKRVYLKIKSLKIQIHRPTLFFFFILFLLTTTYVGIGFVEYSNGQNTVQPSLHNNSIIDLRASSVEKFTNMYMYDYFMKISSSGTFNTVNRVEVTPVYNNLSTSITNPTYVWTIVYDFSGTKLIHPVLIFKTTSGMSNMSINTTIEYKVFSSGLLASPVKTFSIDTTVIV